VTSVNANTKVFVAFCPMVIRAGDVVVRRIRNGRALCVTIVTHKIKMSGVLGRVSIRRRISILAPSVIPSVLRLALPPTTCVVKFLPAVVSAMRAMVMVHVL